MLVTEIEVIEDESGEQVYAEGHYSSETFIYAVNTYDLENGYESEDLYDDWAFECVQHIWMRERDSHSDILVRCKEDDESALPYTFMSRP